MVRVRLIFVATILAMASTIPAAIPPSRHYVQELTKSSTSPPGNLRHHLIDEGPKDLSEAHTVEETSTQPVTPMELMPGTSEIQFSADILKVGSCEEWLKEFKELAYDCHDNNGCEISGQVQLLDVFPSFVANYAEKGALHTAMVSVLGEETTKALESVGDPKKNLTTYIYQGSVITLIENFNIEVEEMMKNLNTKFKCLEYEGKSAEWKLVGGVLSIRFNWYDDSIDNPDDLGDYEWVLLTKEQWKTMKPKAAK